MSELPKGWVEIPLEKVATWGSGGTPKRSEPSYYGGDVPWVKTGDLGPRYLRVASEYISQLGLAKSSAKVFPKGSVAIAMYGATIGKTSILDFEASTNQACAVGNPIDGVILTDFLYYFLTSEKQNFIKKGKGGAQPNISQQLIKAHEIKLAPLAEQKRIVAKLDEVLAQVDTIKARLDRIPAILKRFRQSVLAAAVSGKLTEEWRLLNKYQSLPPKIGKEKYKTDLFDSTFKSLPELPAEWLVVPAAHILEYITSGSRGWADYYSSSGALFLRMSNVRYDTTKLDLSDLQYVNLPENVEGKRSLVKENDLVISITADVGRVARIDRAIEEAYVNQHLALARPTSHINSEFLAKCIASANIGIKQVQALKRGATKAGLGLDDIRSMAIPFPPLKEQEEIVRLVDHYFVFADTIEAQVKKAQARVDNLTQSILAKAFRGELVAQDPNDEPADKLLERIAQARTEAEALAKTAKKVGRKGKATS